MMRQIDVREGHWFFGAFNFILITQFKCFWEILFAFFFFPEQKEWEIMPCASRQPYVLPYWANNYWEKINEGQILNS